MRKPRTESGKGATLSPASAGVGARSNTLQKKTSPTYEHLATRDRAGHSDRTSVRAMTAIPKTSTGLETLQRAADLSHASRRTAPMQRMADDRANADSAGGLPGSLRRGAEQLSGIPLGDVRVHRNSAEPARVNAHAFAQGRDIHLGPGQEQHLPHEAWHVVQQRQGRVRATRQLKPGAGVNDDPALEREADIMGARAQGVGVGSTALPLQARSSENTNVLQLRAETVKITGLTHLVRMRRDRTTLYGGTNDKALRSGDLVTIERRVAYKSRRGPNQEVQKNRDADRTGPQHYTYYQAKDVNGDGVAGNDLYLRDETFNRAPDDSFDTQKSNLIEAKTQLRDFKTEGAEVVRAFSATLDRGRAHPAFAHFDLVEHAPIISELHASIARPVPGQLADVQRELQMIDSVMGNVAMKVEKLAHTARRAGDADFGKALIGVADSASQLSASIQRAPVSAGGDAVRVRADQIATGFNVADVGQTTVGGLVGGILGAATIPLQGTTAAAVATGFGYAAGPLGILFGLVGMALGVRAAWNGYHSEKELNRLIPGLDNTDVRKIARYAAEQKRKKKWGGAITTTVGVAAVIGGVVGIAALSILTLGIGAAILGIGAALMGLGVVIGKIYHHYKKRKKWRDNMASLVLAAVSAGRADAFPSELMSLGAAVAPLAEGSSARKQAMKALTAGCVKFAESRRQLMANQTIEYLVHGSPAARYDVSMVVSALKLDPEDLRQKALDRGQKTAASLVARKLKSW